MNRITVLLSGLMLFGTVLCAQEKRDTIRSVQKSTVAQKSTAKEKRNALSDSLDLTREQAKQLKAITQDFRAEVKSIREDKNLSARERRTQQRALIARQQKEVEKILSPEQFEKYKRLMRERVKNRKEAEIMEDEL